MNTYMNQIKRTAVAVLMALPLMAGSAGADELGASIESIRADIRANLVVVPATPSTVPLAESIRMQGEQAMRRIVLEAELSIYRSAHTSGNYTEVARTGTVTVSSIEVADSPYSESY